MIKQISVMKRNPALSLEKFIEIYEARHAKFGETLFANARRYVRRYVHPEVNPLTGEVTELDFDVIMEIWWASREEQQVAMKGILTSGLLDAVKASGEELFASQANPAFTVEEYESVLGG